MSYNEPDNFDWKIVGLSVFDIATLHYKFGVNHKARTGNDVYDITKTMYVWDGSGTDAIVANNATDKAYINLNAGSWNYIGSKADTLSAGNQSFLGYDTQIEKVWGGKYDDTITGNAVNNTIQGGDGKDLIKGGNGDDVLFGQNDNDTLYGDQGKDILVGGNGVDKIYGGDGVDKLYGGIGADTLYGGNDNDTLQGGDDNDTLNGGNGNDVLFGEQGNDKLHGDQGNDILVAGNGDDILKGGDGIDRLYGGIGADKLYGGNDNDTLQGSDGNDGLYGDNGDDILFGENGNDTLNGGMGNDWLIGGSGGDTFIFDDSLSSNNIDKIPDFVSMTDVLQLDNSIFKGLDEGQLQANNFIANSTGQAQDSNDHIIYNTANGHISYDADGSGAGQAQVFAILTNHAELTYNDIVII